MTRPFFSKERVSDYDIFDRHAETVIKAMKKRVEDGYPVEFQVSMFYVFKFTLSVNTTYSYLIRSRKFYKGRRIPIHPRFSDRIPVQ